jgi:membrane fusion protein (multidrug efflux system)
MEKFDRRIASRVRDIARTTCLALALACASGCGHHGDEEGGEVDVAAMHVPVAVMTVRPDTLTDALVLTGRLAPIPNGSVVLSAPAAGVVSRVNAQVGSTVARGALLVDLDVPELVSQVRQLSAKATAAEREAQRQKELLVEGITSRKETEDAEATAAAAVNDAAAARALLARTHVRSPIAGAVQRVLVERGEQVAEGSELVEVINSSSLDFTAQVPAEGLARLRVGQAATIIAEGDTRSYPGRVQAIAPAVDSVTNAGQIVIRIPNPGGMLRAGSAATASIHIATVWNALVVPDSSLVQRERGYALFVVGPDSVAHERAVAIGVREPTRAEVTHGLAAGERIVTTGAYGLQNGMHVVPRVRSVR